MDQKEKRNQELKALLVSAYHKGNHYSADLDEIMASLKESLRDFFNIDEQIKNETTRKKA